MEHQVITEKKIDREFTYLKGPLLGKGSYSQCYMLTDEHNNTFACKVIKKSSLTERSLRLLKSEITVHRVCDHKNIVQFIRYFEDTHNVYILLEKCDESLMDALKEQKILTEDKTRYFLKHIVEGVMYLHEQNIVHRDIKLSNIFVRENVAKIGDFGMALKLMERLYVKCGTPNYIAPEVLRGTGYGFEVDIWAIGVVLYTLLLGAPPFEAKGSDKVYQRIIAIQYSFPNTVAISANAKHLIEQILVDDYKSRPSPQDILKHPFIRT